ncbi:MAG: SiaB family protein kinase [Salinivirgaceae bacterium]|jgi:hypothetical protein|nr:SiaB family protein kinase [Salinivirgaceae bacterium]
MTQVRTSTILTYKGHLNFETIEEILNQFREKIRPYNAELVVRRRMYSILVECLENTYKHKALKNNTPKHPPVELVLTQKDDAFEIKIGNYILEKKVDVLINKISKVNALDREGLNKLYRKSISEARISDKGGAGLGIIEIARNSSQSLSYEMSPLEGKHIFFDIVVHVKKINL